MSRIIWPVILTVREWQFLMQFRWRWYAPEVYIWSRTTMPRYRRWKRVKNPTFIKWVGGHFHGADMSAGWEH
jgi:hypothetical protein